MRMWLVFSITVCKRGQKAILFGSGSGEINAHQGASHVVRVDELYVYVYQKPSMLLHEVRAGYTALRAHCQKVG